MHRNFHNIVLLVLALCVQVMASCDGGKTKGMTEMKSSLKLSEKELSALARKSALFGHMSVGSNIMAGVTAMIAEDKRLSSLKVMEVRDGIGIDGPGVFHIRIGSNGQPKGKCDNFSALLKNGGLGERLDIALLKFCYADVQRGTDVRGLFEYYVRMVDSLRQTFPRLRLIHATVPLTEHSSGLKSLLRNLIVGDLANVQRNRFNDLLREKYMGTETIYDLAALESTLPDGSREVFTSKGKTYFALASAYTTDGGHLNEAGKRVAAEGFLAFMARAANE